MGQLIVVLWLTSTANIVAKPTPLDFHKITATDAVIRDIEESETNHLNNIETQDETEKILVYKRYDVPITVTTIESQYDFDYYEKEETKPQAYVEQNKITESFFDTDSKGQEHIEAQTVNAIETSNKNADFGIYHFETFDAMDALIHKREPKSTTETPTEMKVFQEPPTETELIIESPRELKLTMESPRVSKPTTESPVTFKGSLIMKTLTTSSPAKIKYSYNQVPVKLVLPSPPKPAASPPEIPKTLQSVFKYHKLQELQPPTIPTLQVPQFPTFTYKIATLNPNDHPINSTENVFYKLKQSTSRKKPSRQNILNYIPSVDDYNAPTKVTNPSTQNYLPPHDALISAFNPDKLDQFRSTDTQEHGFHTTSEIYTPPFRNHGESENFETFENFYSANEIDYDYYYYDTENRVSNTEKFSQIDIYQPRNQERNQKNVETNDFQIPSLLDDPVLNFLAYGTVFGMAIQSLGGNPFDVVNVELRNLRKKRSYSDG